MVNWINGHNDHFGFKALVCHDGVFDTVTTFFSTEEVWFPVRSVVPSDTMFGKI